MASFCDGSAEEEFDEEEWYFEGFHPIVDLEYGGVDESFYVEHSGPFFHKNVGWTYIYDLDDLVFTVDGSVHFRLDNVPRGPNGILRYLYWNGCGGSVCRAPSTPYEYLPVRYAKAFRVAVYPTTMVSIP